MMRWPKLTCRLPGAAARPGYHPGKASDGAQGGSASPLEGSCYPRGGVGPPQQRQATDICTIAQAKTKDEHSQHAASKQKGSLQQGFSQLSPTALLTAASSLAACQHWP